MTVNRLHLFLPDKSNGGPGTNISRNWRELEAWSQLVTGGPSGLAWGYEGPLIVASLLPQQADVGGFTRFRGTLTVAGGTATVITFNKNGLSMGTLTIPAGSVSASVDVTTTTALGDIVIPVITTPGANAVDLTVQADY